MLLAAIQIELEIIISNEIERQISYDITYIQSPKYNKHGVTYETETNSHTQKTDLWLSKEREGGEGCNGSMGLVNVNYYII